MEGSGESESSEYLLVEYKRLMELYWRTESLGEGRVTFFITLTTALMGSLAVFFRGRGLSSGNVEPVFFYVIVALLMLGAVTLARMIRRNLMSYKFLYAAARIRGYFTKRDSSIEEYLYWKANDRPIRKREWGELFSLGTGGLIQTVSLVNSLLVGLFFGLCALAYQIPSYPCVGLVGILTGWIIQFWYVKYRYDKERPKD